MTQEGQGPRPEETPRPVTTRWSEDPVANDDELAPPFVPGRGAGLGSGPPAPDDQPPADTDPWADSDEEVGAEISEITAHEEAVAVPEAGDTADGEDDAEAYPFDSSWDQAEEPAGEEADFPFDQIEHEPETDDYSDLEADRGDLLPGEGGPTPAPEDAVAAQPGPDGWEPFGADAETEESISPDTEPATGFDPGYEAAEPYAETEPHEEAASYADAEPYVDAESSTEPYAEFEGESEEVGAEAEVGAAEVGAEVEVAALLERLADRLREEGAVGLRAEMESDDRLTSLVAGLLAGYVSGRS